MESANSFSGKKFRLLLGKTTSLLLLNDGEHFTTINKLQNEIKISNILKIVEHAYNIRAVDGKQNVLLIDRMLSLACLYRRLTFDVQFIFMVKDF